MRELITLVDEPTRSFLEKSLALDNEVVALTVLGPFGGAQAPDKVREHEQRVREGLV